MLRNSVDPRAKPFSLAELAEAAMHARENLLQNVVDVGG
jgi:hypothetical protein